MRTLRLTLALAGLLVAVGLARAAYLDPATGRSWTAVHQITTRSSSSWDYANALAAEWVEDGYDDYRLPTRAELVAIMESGFFETNLMPRDASGEIPMHTQKLWTSERRGNKGWYVGYNYDETGHVVDVWTALAPRGYYFTMCFVRP